MVTAVMPPKARPMPKPRLMANRISEKDLVLVASVENLATATLFAGLKLSATRL